MALLHGEIPVGTQLQDTLVLEQLASIELHEVWYGNDVRQPSQARWAHTLNDGDITSSCASVCFLSFQSPCYTIACKPAIRPFERSIHCRLVRHLSN